MQREYTIAEVAGITRQGERTIWSHVYSGQLPYVRRGRLVRILAEDLEEYRTRERQFGKAKDSDRMLAAREALRRRNRNSGDAA